MSETTGPKLLLIDGNNMCHRVFWANKTLAYNGKATGVLFGFMKQLISLHKDYPDHFRVIGWDRGHARRDEESQKAVEAGVIPSAYKANREMDEAKKAELEPLFTQMDQLKELLDMMRCMQVQIRGVECDDILFSYSKYAVKWNGEVVAVSSDSDFFQFLSLGGNIKIHDPMKQEIYTAERFATEFGFPSSLWLDAGSMVGEKGDNIFGVDGWGPVTAYKYTREIGDIDKIIAAIQAKEKRSKKEQALLDQEPRLRLAKSLRKMDDIPNLPRPRIMKTLDQKEIEKRFIELGFASLLKDIWRLV